MPGRGRTLTTSPARFGSTCGLFIDLDPGDSIDPDDFVTTTGGSAYLVLSSRRVAGRHPNRWSMRVARFDPAAVPADARVVEMRWYRRERR